ncbi:hypothetical protein NDU88_004260 [Pleurodeles waltl]|uniref:Uncharacterized protein n=1 Tax=Pleurodeles waltl TaxID=8319 RepID=A0AAV7TS20_PLEWA|nr:hypothetical protein NDU88_004260 [Pleurodeles waltl]
MELASLRPPLLQHGTVLQGDKDLNLHPPCLIRTLIRTFRVNNLVMVLLVILKCLAQVGLLVMMFGMELDFDEDELEEGEIVEDEVPEST